jgi:hypothetical protein
MSKYDKCWSQALTSMTFEVLTWVLLEIPVFWGVMLHHWASGSQCSKRSYTFLPGLLDHEDKGTTPSEHQKLLTNDTASGPKDLNLQCLTTC